VGLLAVVLTLPSGSQRSQIADPQEIDGSIGAPRLPVQKKTFGDGDRPLTSGRNGSTAETTAAVNPQQPLEQPAEQPPPSPPITESSNFDAVAESLPSVAVIQVGDGHGSGFLAAPNLLVTNYHVIRMSRISDIRISFPDNPQVRDRRFTADLVAENPINDIAVLRVDCDAPPLRLQDDYRHVNGQKVVAIGSPGTGVSVAGDMLPNLTTPGRLGPPYKLPNGAECWALSMAINPGNSGGPIIDESRGHVIGVAVATFTKTQSQGLAVPHPSLLEILRRAQSSTDAEMRRELFLHRARFCLVHMSQLLQLTALSFEASGEKADETKSTSEQEWLEAFNHFKSNASRILSDEIASFETVVHAEVLAMQSDTECDMSVRLAVTRLREAIAEQVADLRKPVRSGELRAAVQHFREGLQHAISLAESTANLLKVEIDDE